MNIYGSSTQSVPCALARLTNRGALKKVVKLQLALYDWSNQWKHEFKVVRVEDSLVNTREFGLKVDFFKYF